MQMQVWDGLAHYVIDENHRPVGLKSGFDRPLKSLCFHEKFLYPLHWQLAHQEHMDLRDQQDVTVEQRPMIQERHKILILVDERYLLIAPQYSTESALRVASALLGHGLSIASVK
jgi:hypothetical protein